MSDFLKDRLRRGELSVGTWVSIGHPDVAEILSHAGYEWLMFDMEHGPLTLSILHQQMQAMDATKTLPIVRVARNDNLLIGQALDAGAAGVAVPLIRTRAEAERAVAAALYPPQGQRGIGPRRACRYGRDFAGYLAGANERTLVILMVETPDAIAAIDEIVSVPGVDAVIVGTGDLSANMGCFHERGRPDFVEALSKVVAACRKHEVVPGIGYVGSAATAKNLVAQGFRLIGLGEDVDHLTRGAAALLEQFHGRL